MVEDNNMNYYFFHTPAIQYDLYIIIICIRKNQTKFNCQTVFRKI